MAGGKIRLPNGYITNCKKENKPWKKIAKIRILF
jgi:hypothetical protein